MKIRKISKGFGARYGFGLKKKVDLISSTYKNIFQKCPKCNKKKVKRIAFGIWKCKWKKCSHKFSGGAYMINYYEKTKF